MRCSVAVVGGGYGGSLVAKALDAETDVVLIDPREAFVNAAGSLRALVRPDWAPNIFFPFDKLLERGRVVRDEAVSVDPSGVTLASGERVDADYLVLAMGSGHTHPAKPRPGTTGIDEALKDLLDTHGELSASARVLVLGAGPVGLELAGEIKEVWPEKQVVIVERGEQLLPGFLPEVREELHAHLDELGVELRLGTALTAPPESEPGRAERFTVTTETGDEIEADIWFRAFGVSLNTSTLADGKLTRLTERGTVPVTERLNVEGYEHVYALGDIVELPDPKMASYAQVQAGVVAANIKAQLAGGKPETVHVITPERRILLPLGPHRGVGQLPAPGGGVTAATADAVSQRKGRDLFTAQFAQRFDRP